MPVKKLERHLLSVLISTHNPKQEYLRRTLEALNSQTLEADKWELIIVDNSSKEPVSLLENIKVEGVAGGGSRVAGSSPSPISHLPSTLNVRVVREERLGLTHARVRGFEEAKGEIVVMVDDDNVLRPDHLEKAVEILDKNPLLGAIGGKALPEYEIEPPEWLKGIRSGLGLRDLGNSIILYPDVKEQGQVEGERCKVEGGPSFAPNLAGSGGAWPPETCLHPSDTVAPRWSESPLPRGDSEGLKTGRVRRKMTEFPDCAPIGAGMVIRREAAMEYADDLKKRSRVVTDRKGKSLSSGGDNDICLTVLEHGWQVGYFPELELTHLIPKERMTVEYQSRMARDAMRSFIVMLDQHGIRPWPAMARWTLPLRVAADWWRVKAWQGTEQRLEFWGHVGVYEGRCALRSMRC